MPTQNGETLSTTNQDVAAYVRLEIRSDTLYALINNKVLVIEDLRVLDQQAKVRIQQLLLDTLLL